MTSLLSKKNFTLAGFVLLKFILQFTLISSDYDLHRDEYLHLDQANHPAWGYQSVPPLTSWFSMLIKALGNSISWIKFFPALFGALTIFVVWKIVDELKGNLFAHILAASCILFSALARINILYQPNSFDILAWTTCYYILIKFINTQGTKWLIAGAIAFAFGFLNKYNVIFLAAGIFPAIPLSPQRKMFLRKDFYLAVLVAAVIMLPNIFWQINHHFPVVHHMKELADTQLVHVNRADFVKSQFMFFLGGIIVLLSGFYALTVYKPFVAYRLFVPAFLFTMALFIYLKAKDYYAIGIYPVYIAFGAVFLGQLLSSGRKRYLQPVAIAIPVLLFIPFYRIGFPNKSPQYIAAHSAPYRNLGLLRWEDGNDHMLPQDFADMLGWKQLAQTVDSVFKIIPDPANTLLLCGNYGETGAINFYSQGSPVANSFNADYINWFPSGKKYSSLLLVKENDDDDSTVFAQRPYFDTIYLAAQRLNPLAREDTISIYLLSGSKIDLMEALKQRAKKEAWDQ